MFLYTVRIRKDFEGGHRDFKTLKGAWDAARGKSTSDPNQAIEAFVEYLGGPYPQIEHLHLDFLLNNVDEQVKVRFCKLKATDGETPDLEGLNWTIYGDENGQQQRPFPVGTILQMSIDGGESWGNPNPNSEFRIIEVGPSSRASPEEVAQAEGAAFPWLHLAEIWGIIPMRQIDGELTWFSIKGLGDDWSNDIFDQFDMATRCKAAMDRDPENPMLLARYAFALRLGKGAEADLARPLEERITCLRKALDIGSGQIVDSMTLVSSGHLAMDYVLDLFARNLANSQGPESDWFVDSQKKIMVAFIWNFVIWSVVKNELATALEAKAVAIEASSGGSAEEVAALRSEAAQLTSS